MKPIFRSPSTVALAALLVLLVVAGAASAQSFRTGVDCGGDFAPGAVVDFELTVENETANDIPVDATISIDVPGQGVILLRAASFVLTSNQNYVNNRQTVRLPDSAPIADDYQILFTVDSETEMTFDTCDFDVR